MKIGSRNGFEFHIPTSGGKAGKGHQVTSTIQIRVDNNIVKQIRFKVMNAASRAKAIEKAKEYADTYFVRCPDCGDKVPNIFAHIDRDCRHS